MRAEKQFLLDDIKNQIARSPSFVLASYKGIDPNKASDFRKLILGTGGFFYVVRKRIFMKAAKESGLSFNLEKLQGHIGIIYSGEEPQATTKAVYSFIKDNEALLEVLGGLFDGRLCSPSQVEEISKLGSKEEVRAELLGLFEEPLSAVVSLMAAHLSGLISCIENKREKDERASGNQGEKINV